MEVREFRGVWFPKEIWFDDRMSALEKVILLEIDSLDNEEKGGCFASNEYLANFCHCSVKMVSNTITKLVGFGFIRVSSFDGRRRIIRSNLRGYVTPNPFLGRVENFAMQDGNDCQADWQNLPTENTNREVYSIDTFKKERKKTDYEAVLEGFCLSDRVKDTLREFIKMRVLIKKPMTDNALKLLINKLRGMTSDEEMQIEILNQSIINGWQSIYPIRDNYNKPKGKRVGPNGVALSDEPYEEIIPGFL